MTFKPAPGKDGATLVPDLAESLGKPSDNAKTWTYTLRKGVKFEDGTPVTSKDVKYDVERSLDKKTFPNGPTYFNDFLDLQGYTSPYEDTDPNKLGLKAIETPDDQTIIFHLAKPFSGFDYFAQLPSTIPVPAAKDTGTKYKEHVVSTGPYMFQNNDLGKSFTLVRNPNWDPATDPNRKALPDRIEVQLNVNADDIDNRLLSGDLDVDVEGTGVAARGAGQDPRRPARSRRTRTPRWWPGRGSPTSARPSRRSTTSTAARPCCTRSTRPATSAPTAARPVVTSPRTCCHRSSPARRSSTRYPTPGNTGRHRQGQGRAQPMRTAQRLHHRHLLPRRAAEGEGDGRVAAAVAGPGRDQARHQALPVR